MFIVTGRNLLGVVAREETPLRWKADQTARAWRESGLQVEVEEREETEAAAPAK